MPTRVPEPGNGSVRKLVGPRGTITSTTPALHRTRGATDDYRYVVGFLRHAH
jgi:hypothetical protein